MVHAMAKDRGKLPRVAWVLALAACGPTVRPDKPVSYGANTLIN